MGSIPRTENPSVMTNVTINVTNNAAGGGAAPGTGPKAKPETFKVLLPLARPLIARLREFADAGKAAEVDLCLLAVLEDWVAMSQAEIDEQKK